ncbi:hypothetical protein HDC92_004292 [Pedobacter sp. AK017]|uniref:hypothetical protein n=1 Tax=Pedobacter sp. AK017 TaxID=2723073 RepID=UPI0016085729|nr:hypothetical protein [Pedobacter sp. AK017]MBB5440589.1 hypothetical protein [Pedobacter sp. AK017]
MTDLVKNGTIYCKPISFFAQKDDSCRFDKNELVVEMQYHEDSLLHLIPLDEPNKIVTLNASQIRHRKIIANPTGNLYCMFLTTIDPSLPILHSPFDARLKEFGSHCVSIHDGDKFFNRIFDHLTKNRVEYSCDEVTYRDLSKFSGEKNMFTKDLAYGWQKEWRLILHTEINEPYIFQIGNLEDIAYIFDTKGIEDKVFVNAALIK